MPCDPHVSQEFMSAMVMASLLMVEMTGLGVLTSFVYLRLKNVTKALTTN